MTSNQFDGGAQLSSASAPLARPPYQLRALPLRFRWEVTRRHPYYLGFWTAALRNAERSTLATGDPIDEAASLVEESVKSAAITLLAMIGFYGAAIPPETEFDALDASTLIASSTFVGSVHPISNRGLLGLLLSALPKQTLVDIAALLLKNLAGEGDEMKQKWTVPRALVHRTDAGLDQFVAEPIVSISPTATSRQLEQDLSPLLERWRTERGLADRRDRSDKYGEYLHIWDLREGWAAGAYNNAAERTLADISQELQLSITTVRNRYTSAFELITGHPYTPERWLQVFGADKFARIFGTGPGPVSRSRPLATKSRRASPDSALMAPGGQNSVVEAIASRRDEDDHPHSKLIEAIREYRDLVNAGRSATEITSMMGLALGGVDELRRLSERFDAAGWTSADGVNSLEK